MHVALTGATGYTGSRLLSRLLARGDEVRALARPGSRRPQPEGPGLTWLDGDLGDAAALNSRSITAARSEGRMSRARDAARGRLS